MVHLQRGHVQDGIQTQAALGREMLSSFAGASREYSKR